MAKAKRARNAETLKQPSLRLRLRASYFYPDYGCTRVVSANVVDGQIYANRYGIVDGSTPLYELALFVNVDTFSKPLVYPFDVLLVGEYFVNLGQGSANDPAMVWG